MISILCNYCPYKKEYNIDPNDITDNVTEDNKDNFCEHYFCYKAFYEYLKEIKNEKYNENNNGVKI